MRAASSVAVVNGSASMRERHTNADRGPCPGPHA
jgi:hypothetical protein